MTGEETGRARIPRWRRWRSPLVLAIVGDVWMVCVIIAPAQGLESAEKVGRAHPARPRECREGTAGDVREIVPETVPEAVDVVGKPDVMIQQQAASPIEGSQLLGMNCPYSAINERELMP